MDLKLKLLKQEIIIWLVVLSLTCLNTGISNPAIQRVSQARHLNQGRQIFLFPCHPYQTFRKCVMVQVHFLMVLFAEIFICPFTSGPLKEHCK